MTDVIASTLARMPLPGIDGDADKEQRGRVLVVGGSTRVPGAMMLAGVAALRAGAGKLQMATVRDAAIALGVAVPEALVAALPQTRDGEIGASRATGVLREFVPRADGVLVGPGMLDEGSGRALLRVLVPLLSEHAVLVVDGPAAVALRHHERLLHALGGRVVLTPHAGETASMLGIDKAEVEADPAAIAQRAARSLNATVALKGAATYIATPDGALYEHRGGGPGLGTSGSGDTLAGIVTGLAARGASPLVAALWAVWAHGAAGDALAERVAPVGFLARELLAEIPRLLAVGTAVSPPVTSGQ